MITESAYRSGAVSPAGAGGLTQLMPATAADLGVSDRFDTTENLRGGAAYPTSSEEAQALLRLLDLTIGAEEGAIYPRELDVALQAIAAHSKPATRTAEFARLTALTRR